MVQELCAGGDLRSLVAVSQRAFGMSSRLICALLRWERGFRSCALAATCILVAVSQQAFGIMSS